jgi:acyl-CoA thioester hydrolase
VSARQGYKHFQSITTRWKDNDIYGHVNNVEYYSYFDTVINSYLIRAGGLDIHAGPAIGLCVESHCRFDGPLEFPDTVDAGLRVARSTNTCTNQPSAAGLSSPARNRPIS